MKKLLVTDFSEARLETAMNVIGLNFVPWGTPQKQRKKSFPCGQCRLVSNTLTSSSHEIGYPRYSISHICCTAKTLVLLTPVFLQCAKFVQPLNIYIARIFTLALSHTQLSIALCAFWDTNLLILWNIVQYVKKRLKLLVMRSKKKVCFGKSGRD